MVQSSYGFGAQVMMVLGQDYVREFLSSGRSSARGIQMATQSEKTIAFLGQNLECKKCNAIFILRNVFPDSFGRNGSGKG